MSTRTNEKPHAVENRVSMWFAAGNQGTTRDIAAACNASLATLEKTLYRMEAAQRAKRVGEVVVAIKLQENHAPYERVAFVWAGDAPVHRTVTQESQRVRNPAIVASALRTVAHLPRWLGGQGASA